MKAITPLRKNIHARLARSHSMPLARVYKKKVAARALNYAVCLLNNYTNVNFSPFYSPVCEINSPVLALLEIDRYIRKLQPRLHCSTVHHKVENFGHDSIAPHSAPPYMYIYNLSLARAHTLWSMRMVQSKLVRFVPHPFRVNSALNN